MNLFSVMNWWPIGGERLISYFPLNGDLIEQVTGTDCASMVDPIYETVVWQSDPLVSGRQCLARSTSTNTGGGNHPAYALPSVPTFYPEYRTTGETSRFKYPMTRIPSAAYLEEAYSMVGYTLEFQYLTVDTSSSAVFIFETIDSLYQASVSGVYGCDLIQQSTRIKINYRITGTSYVTYDLCEVRPYTWYTIRIRFIPTDSDGSYQCIYNIFNGSTSVATWTSPEIPIANNTNTRSVRLFNSSWNYYKSGINTNGRLKEVKLIRES